MKAFILLSVFVVAAVAQLPAEKYAPIPYSFNYLAETEDGGTSGHQESGDGSGRVTGSYTVTNLEGHTRVVDYIADEDGFRANIKSNEPGLDNQNPADVTIESSAPGAGAGPVLNRAPVAPAPRPAAARPGSAGVRYVLVPIND